MQLTVIQCDACQRQGELTEEGWSRFSAAFKGESPIDIDVCPDCRKRIQTGLACLVKGQQPKLVMETVAMVEQRHILAVLTATDWNKTKAAQVLGIERSTLDRKLRQYEVTRPSAVETPE